MTKLHEFFLMTEMPRPRENPAWAVLDWAAQQEGSFTIQDAYRVFTASGGGGSPANFNTIFNKWVAKYDPNSPKERYRNQEKYGLSDRRPIVATGEKSGKSRTYRWALDHALREPPEPDPEFDELEGELSSGDEDDPVGDALDRLERVMDRGPLKAAIVRWRNMNDLNRIVADIKKNVPARQRVDAIHVATQALISSGKHVSKSDAKDAEDEVKGGLPTKAVAKQADPEEIDIDDLLDGDEWEEVPDTAESEPPDFDDFDDLAILKEPPRAKQEPDAEPERSVPPPPTPPKPLPPPPPPSPGTRVPSKFLEPRDPRATDKKALAQEPTKRSEPPRKPWNPFSKVIKKPKP